ncbi:MAG TPA: hypothetical protein VGZ47_05185, partial [Gemmataceae bacterium]|nr:hypothetical protein [Gemmataceae bacterium]
MNPRKSFRPAGRLPVFLRAALLLILLPALARAEAPALRWHAATKSQPACVEVTGLDSATLSQLRDHPPADWSGT